MKKTIVELISQGDGHGREVKKESVLESAEAEMGRVREGNYKSLQLRFFDILQHENSKNCTDLGPTHDRNGTDEHELVSLCLGRSPVEHKNDENSRNSSKTREDDDEELKASLTLSLNPKSHFPSNPSPKDGLEVMKEAEEPGEAWPPSKIQRRNVDEEAALQSYVKKARVCVRARCDTPTMLDGCQWRKYGQKIAKGNPCPRGYYRCTVAPACPVRKQVQRCADDMSILFTTYEGTHNHPLPHSATAMASTTSLAASMLLSGSSASQPGLSSLATATSATDLNGLNFSLYDSSRTKQFYLPYSPSPMFPTITVDLTASPSTSSSTPSNRFPSTFTPTSELVPPTSLNLSSEEFNILPSMWGSGNGFQGCSTPPYCQTSTGSFDLGKQCQGRQQCRQQSYIEKNHHDQAAASQQDLTETLTKAITSDPSLRTVIVAALSSLKEAGTGSSTINGNQGPRESFGQSLKLGEPDNQAITSNALTQNEKACASAYFSRFSSSACPRAGSSLQVRPPSPSPISTPTSAFLPDTNKEQRRASKSVH